MRTTTLKFTVQGDNYEELKQAADLAISKFLGGTEDDLEDEEYLEEEISNHGINYELIVYENSELTSEYQYSAEVIARIKDVQ
jgi:hypothetical protein